jgi:hypothetical protein
MFKEQVISRQCNVVSNASLSAIAYEENPGSNSSTQPSALCTLPGCNFPQPDATKFSVEGKSFTGERKPTSRKILSLCHFYGRSASHTQNP